MPVSFETKLNDGLKSLEADSSIIRENLQIISSGRGRAGHFNKVSETIAKMKDAIKIIRRLNLHDELVLQETSKRVKDVLDASIRLVKEQSLRLEREQVQEQLQQAQQFQQSLAQPSQSDSPQSTPAPQVDDSVKKDEGA